MLFKKTPLFCEASLESVKLGKRVNLIVLLSTIS